MKTMLCLLLMLPFLAAWGPKPQWFREDHKSQAAAKKKPFKIALPQSRAQKPQKRKVPYLCAATGEFNLAPKHDQIIMETVCVPENPRPGAGGMLKVNIAVKRVTNHFPIPFKQDAKLSFKVVKGQPVLTLTWQDDGLQLINLRFHSAKRYKNKYTFAYLVPGDIAPKPLRRMK